MSSNNCAVLFCKKSRKDCKAGSSVSFHRFPKTASIRASWIKRCGRKDKFNIDLAVVCSDHFSKDDFEGGLRNELMAGVPFKKILKRTAVPSINVYKEEETAQFPDSDTENSVPDDDFIDDFDQATPDVLRKELKDITKKFRMLVLEFQNLKIKSSEQEAKILSLQKENSVLKKALFKKN